MRRISMGLSWQSRADIDDFVERARLADDSGVAVLFTGENWRREAFAPMAVLARETHQAHLGTSIVNVWSRSAAALAEHFGTLDELSGGRVIIGLGSSSANVAEHFAGVPYDRPLRRMREYVEIMRQLLAGDALQYQGDLFRLERGFRLDMDLPRSRIPILIASMTPASVRQTAEIADGWMPADIPRSRWKDAIAEFRAHALTAGRDPESMMIRTPSAVVITADPEAEYERLRGTVAFHIARMGDSYYNQFVRMGSQSVGEAVREAWAEGGSRAGTGALPEALAREYGFAGSAEAAAEYLDAQVEAGFNLHSVTITESEPARRRDILRTLVG